MSHIKENFLCDLLTKLVFFEMGEGRGVRKRVSGGFFCAVTHLIFFKKFP